MLMWHVREEKNRWGQLGQMIQPAQGTRVRFAIFRVGKSKIDTAIRNSLSQVPFVIKTVIGALPMAGAFRPHKILFRFVLTAF